MNKNQALVLHESLYSIGTARMPVFDHDSADIQTETNASGFLEQFRSVSYQFCIAMRPAPFVYSLRALRVILYSKSLEERAAQGLCLSQSVRRMK